MKPASLSLTAIAIPLWLLAAAPALAQGQGQGQESFVLPSGNIGCTFTPRGGTAVYQPSDGGPELSCDRVEPNYTRVTLGRRGPAQIERNVGDPSCCDAGPVLAYGQVWRRAPFACESSQSGLKCRRDDGKGFSVSRRGIAVD